MCTLEITLLFLSYDTMEVISRIGTAVAPSPSQSTQEVDRKQKKRPSKNTPLSKVVVAKITNGLPS